MTHKKKNLKKIARRSFMLLLLMMLAAVILGTIVLNNPTIAENWVGLNEYEVAAIKDTLLRSLPYIWLTASLFCLLFAIIYGLRKKKRGIMYWLLTVVGIPSLLLASGILTTTIPIDQSLFRESTSTTKIMGQLVEKNSLKGRDIQLLSFSFHIRNVPQKSGVYAVTRIINPETKLQDEYWYYPTNLLNKWTKATDSISLPVEETIDYNEIDWAVIPKIIKDTEHRVSRLSDRYYRGVDIVILNSFQDEWRWTVGVEGVRGHTEKNYVYDLSGTYLSEWE